MKSKNKESVGFADYLAIVLGFKGWRRFAFTFACGAITALAMPPFNFFPLLWVAFPLLILQLRQATGLRQAFALGWSFSFGFLVCSLYWIAASMFVDIAKFWWAVPFAIAGLPALFAIYYGLAALLAKRIGLNGVAGAMTFGLLWFAADYARGHLFTGFPWNLYGYTWTGALPMLQSTSLFGIYGLTLITILAASLPAAMHDEKALGKKAVFASMVILALFASFGALRLQETTVTTVPGVTVRLVQPNIDQARKWRMGSREGDFQSLLNLTAHPADPMPTHVIWPETASTYYLAEDTPRRRAIADRIPAASTVLTGVIRRSLDNDGKTLFYNSLVAVDGMAKLVAGYDKSHLVPFGEYMPFRNILPVKALAAGDADFSSGTGPRSLRVLGLPAFSPLICYEAIFPGEVVDEKDRPELIVNITNDAWYGNTTGPYQHLAIVKVRAVEEGLPLFRVANTGISAVINPVGRVTKLLGLNKKGIIDSDVYSPLPLTFFAKWGQLPLLVVFLIAVAVTTLLRPKGKSFLFFCKKTGVEHGGYRN